MSSRVAPADGPKKEPPAGDAPANEPSKPAARDDKTSPDKTAAAPASDDPAAVAAIEKIGGKVTRNANGAVTGVDLSQASVKDFDFALLKKLPALARLELFGADVNNATLDKLQGLKLKELVLENTEITDEGTAQAGQSGHAQVAEPAPLVAT